MNGWIKLSHFLAHPLLFLIFALSSRLTFRHGVLPLLLPTSSRYSLCRFVCFGSSFRLLRFLVSFCCGSFFFCFIVSVSPLSLSPVFRLLHFPFISRFPILSPSNFSPPSSTLFSEASLPLPHILSTSLSNLPSVFLYLPLYLSRDLTFSLATSRQHSLSLIFFLSLSLSLSRFHAISLSLSLSLSYFFGNLYLYLSALFRSPTSSLNLPLTLALVLSPAVCLSLSSSRLAFSPPPHFLTSSPSLLFYHNLFFSPSASLNSSLTRSPSGGLSRFPLNLSLSLSMRIFLSLDFLFCRFTFLAKESNSSPSPHLDLSSHSLPLNFAFSLCLF